MVNHMDLEKRSRLFGHRQEVKGDSSQPLDNEAVKALTRVLEELAQSWQSPDRGVSRSTANHSFSTDDIIQAVDMFFDQLVDNEATNNATRRLLIALQLPVLRAATQNPNFLTDAHHPARRLIKAVFIRASVLNDPYESHPLYRDMYRIVKAVEHDFHSDERIFLKAYFDICQLRS